MTTLIISISDHKQLLIDTWRAQAGQKGNHLPPICIAEADTIIHSCWKTIIDLGAVKRKYCGTPYIFPYILRLGRSRFNPHLLCIYVCTIVVYPCALVPVSHFFINDGPWMAPARYLVLADLFSLHTSWGVGMRCWVRDGATRFWEWRFRFETQHIVLYVRTKDLYVCVF
jgi:hypothetical protein